MNCCAAVLAALALALRLVDEEEDDEDEDEDEVSGPKADTGEKPLIEVDMPHSGNTRKQQATDVPWPTKPIASGFHRVRRKPDRDEIARSCAIRKNCREKTSARAGRRDAACDS
jgi:hypothetical protein